MSTVELALRTEDPPSSRQGRPVSPKWEAARQFVRGAGGAWCVVLEVPFTRTASMEVGGAGKSAFKGDKGFETAVRRVGEVVRLYARWGGEGSDVSGGGPGGERVADGGGESQGGGPVPGGG